jgi:hypothetical protein
MRVPQWRQEGTEPDYRGPAVTSDRCQAPAIGLRDELAGVGRSFVIVCFTAPLPALDDLSPSNRPAGRIR